MTDKRTKLWAELQAHGYTRNGGAPPETPRHGSSKVQAPKTDKK